jgi:hypothetical protein
MRTVGRPPKDPSEKKRKIHVAVDPEIYEFLQTQENKSEFINKAAWILLRAYRKAERR